MNKYSQKSRRLLDSCHPDLIRLMEEVLKHWDHTIVSGHRGEQEQNDLYADGKSKLKYPKSKHNTFPSIAVDVQPYPYKDDRDLYAFMGFVLGTAQQMGIELRWGGDWNDNRQVGDNWIDAFHIELRNP